MTSSVNNLAIHHIAYIIPISTFIVALFPIIYKIMQFLAAGNFYRIKISKSDTNLNITEKLLESASKFANTGIKLTPGSEEICKKIIEESLFHIHTGCKVKKEQFDIYFEVLGYTGLSYISCFATKIKKPYDTLYDSCVKARKKFILLVIISLSFSFISSIFIGHVLTKTTSLTSITLNIKQSIELYSSVIILVAFILLYLISFNGFSNSLILLNGINRSKKSPKVTGTQTNS